MPKIGSYTLSATCTSADLTEFAYTVLHAGINGYLKRYWQQLPAVSAATCCASILLHDTSHNEIWRTDAVKDHSTQAEGTSATVNITENVPIVNSNHLHVEWSARPCGDSAGGGLDTTAVLKVFIEEIM